MTTRRGIVAGGVTLAAALVVAAGLMLRGEKGDGSGAAGAAGVLAITAAPDAPGVVVLPDDASGGVRVGGVEPLVADEPALDAGAAEAAAAADGFGSLVVALTWAADGGPAPGIPVRVTQWDDANADALLGRTDEAGTWSVARCPAGVLMVSTDRGGRGRVVVREGAEARVALQVPVGVDVSGVVVDAAGAPVARAGIWLSEGLTPGNIATHADDNGRFALRSLVQRSRFGARAAGHAPSALVPVEASVGSMTVTLRLVDGAAVRGVVLDPGGNPVSGARVQFDYADGDPLELRLGITTERPPPVDLLTDSDGRFEADELPASWLLLRARAPGWSPVWDNVELPAAQTTELTVKMYAPATISGTVRDVAGRPVAMATITTPWHDDFGPHEVIAGEDGTFTLHEVPAKTPFTFILTAGATGLVRATRECELSPGENLRWDPVLTGSVTLSVRVVDLGGRPVEGYLVWARIMGKQPRESGGLSRMARTDAGGRATIADCGDTTVTLRVLAPRASLPLVTMRDVPASANELLITVPDSPPVARLHGRVLDASGHAPRSLRVNVLSEDLGDYFDAVIDVATGSFASRDLGPGDYEVVVSAEGISPTKVDVPALLADEDRDLGVIRLSGGGP